MMWYGQPLCVAQDRSGKGRQHREDRAGNRRQNSRLGRRGLELHLGRAQDLICGMLAITPAGVVLGGPVRCGGLCSTLSSHPSSGCGKAKLAAATCHSQEVWVWGGRSSPTLQAPTVILTGVLGGAKPGL